MKIKGSIPLKNTISLVTGVILLICLVGVFSIGGNDNSKDLKGMMIGAEMPYLIYANTDYCIIDMWHGGVIIYDFSKQKIKRVSYEQLAKVGFKYPVPMVSSDGETIYFAEDSLTEELPITYSYSLKNHKLDKVSNEATDFVHHKDFYSSNATQKLLSDGFVYGATFIELDDQIIVLRLKEGGYLLSDIEIVLFDENMESMGVFPIFDDK